MIGDPSRLRLIRNVSAFARILPHFDFSIDEKAARRKWTHDQIALTELLKLQKAVSFPMSLEE